VDQLTGCIPPSHSRMDAACSRAHPITVSPATPWMPSTSFMISQAASAGWGPQRATAYLRKRAWWDRATGSSKKSAESSQGPPFAAL